MPDQEVVADLVAEFSVDDTPLEQGLAKVEEKAAEAGQNAGAGIDKGFSGGIRGVQGSLHGLSSAMKGDIQGVGFSVLHLAHFFGLAQLGAVGMGLAIGAALGNALRQFKIVSEAADNFFANLFGNQEAPLGGKSRGEIRDIRRQLKAEEMTGLDIEKGREEGFTDKELRDFQKKANFKVEGMNLAEWAKAANANLDPEAQIKLRMRNMKEEYDERSEYEKKQEEEDRKIFQLNQSYADSEFQHQLRLAGIVDKIKLTKKALSDEDKKVSNTAEEQYKSDERKLSLQEELVNLAKEEQNLKKEQANAEFNLAVEAKQEEIRKLQQTKVSVNSLDSLWNKSVTGKVEMEVKSKERDLQKMERDKHHTDLLEALAKIKEAILGQGAKEAVQ